MNTKELRERLQRHYIKPGAPLPGGIFLPEVGWNGGVGGGCDAIYVGFTSTSGRVLVGHELKISRADWLTELNKPGKADKWADECHQWYLVVSDPAIVHEGELPHGWGLMSPSSSKTRMTVHTKAESKIGHTPSWPAVRSIMARQDTLRAQTIADIRHTADIDARATVGKQIEAEVERRMQRSPDTDEIRRRLKLLEEALGEAPDYGDNHWGALKLEEITKIAEAAKAYGSLNAAVRRLSSNYELASLRRTMDDIGKKITEFAQFGEGEGKP